MRRPDLPVPTYDGRRFSWDRCNGVAEATDLCPTPSRTPVYEQPWARVWSDAADVGFNVRSNRTGRVELFTLRTEHKDDDGDVTHWTFVASTDPTITVTIIND